MRLSGALAVTALASALAAASATAAPPLQTAVFLHGQDLLPANAPLAMKRTRRAGATGVRLILSWRQVAPAIRPAGFDPTNPADPSYDWAEPDRLISLARAAGLQPIVGVSSAPDWAGGTRVKPADFGAFARAAAKRYSGTFQGLPRVRYWLAWNEPNLSKYLTPQTNLAGAKRYRSMVNAFSDSVHAVSGSNVVVAGLVAPFTSAPNPGPMKFLRGMLCLSKRDRPSCSARTRFDILAVHPYTSGGPTHHAFSSNDVSLGDLSEVRTLLRAASRYHHIVSSRPPRFWITEFSWDSKPPDPHGVPMALETRWVAEMLYRSSRAGVGLVSWFQLRDDALRVSPYQAGLYFRGSRFATAKPKPILTAFRFPFVAYRNGGRVTVWGRTPGSNGRTVAIEAKPPRRSWRRVAQLRSGANGVFARVLRLKVTPAWSMRARVRKDSAESVKFSLRRPPDRFVRPFG